MSLATKVAYNTIIQIMGKAISTILGLAAVAIMTRFLGKSGFGQYTTVITYLSFFGIIADFGLTLVTAQMISQPGIDQNKILGNLFGLRLISAIVFLGLAPFIIVFFPYEPIIKLGVAIATLSFFFIALNQILVGLYQKNLKMEIVSLAEIVGRIFLLIGIVMVIYCKAGLLGMVMATVLGSLVNFIIHYYFSHRLAQIKFLFDFNIWREIIKKSWPIALTIIFNLIYLRADILILSLIKSQAEVGIYGATYKVIDILTTLPFMFAGIILPIITLSWAEKKFDNFNKVIQRSFDLMIIISLPLIIGSQFVSKQIMILIAGNDFAASGEILRILILATGFIFIGCLFSHAIIAVEEQKRIIKAYIFTALTALAGYLILIPRYSYFGAAWVTVYSEFTIALASYYLVIKKSKFSPKLNILLKSMFASVIMALFIYLFLSLINLFLIIVFAIFVYFFTFFLIKGFSKQDIINLVTNKHV